jgi:phosphoribosyl 1,2-cyclic phosphate phosphodiesterase
MSLTLTILGCGSSGGVPRPGQGWGLCDPSNPRNRRRRCSLLVEKTAGEGVTTLVIDTAPDLREQMIDAGVTRIDAVTYTHAHADQCHGIDDLRPFVIMHRRRIPAYLDEPTAQRLHEAFGYIFATPPGSFYPPLLDERLIAPGEAFTIEGAGGPMQVLPFRLEHGEIPSLGFRIGGAAYLPDVSGIPEDSAGCLENLDLLIIDALRHTRHPSHFSVPDALGWIARLKPKRAVLTNLHTDLDYARLAADLPAGVEPAYDGMRLAI